MYALSFLAFATPVFGLAYELEAPAADALVLAQLASNGEGAGGDDEASASLVDDQLREDIAERERLKPWHIAFGNLAWASTTLTLVLGFITYNDRYGFGAAEADTPCARGDPILGSDGCTGVALPHTIAAGALTLFYGAAFATSIAMPDPLDAGESEGTYGTRIRLHRALRWALLGLIVAQVVFGVVNANVDADYDTHAALAGAHLAVGVTTWLTMGAQGIVGSLLAY